RDNDLRRLGRDSPARLVRQVKELGDIRNRRAALILAALTFFVAASADCAGGAPGASPKLKSENELAFGHYVRLTEERNTEELRRGSPFLWIDELPEKERAAAYETLRSGATKIERRKTLDAGREIHCPSGLIHHWEATAFIQGTTVDNVLSVLEDYGHHSEYYKPDMQRSKTL